MECLSVSETAWPLQPQDEIPAAHSVTSSLLGNYMGGKTQHKIHREKKKMKKKEKKDISSGGSEWTSLITKLIKRKIPSGQLIIKAYLRQRARSWAAWSGPASPTSAKQQRFIAAAKSPRRQKNPDIKMELGARILRSFHSLLAPDWGTEVTLRACFCGGVPVK